MPLDSKKLYDKIDYLRVINQEQMIDRSRIRDIMNGGEAAVKALLGNSVNVEYHELPAPNLFLTALERFAQKLGRSPDLKVVLCVLLYLEPFKYLLISLSLGIPITLSQSLHTRLITKVEESSFSLIDFTTLFKCSQLLCKSSISFEILRFFSIREATFLNFAIK